MGPVLTPDGVRTELISRTPIWSPSIRFGEIFHREDGFLDIVCNMSIKKTKSRNQACNHLSNANLSSQR